ncbi:hypothetical protein LUZ60_014519 [Juncus effusus]|nr:hypothetical protein LUZ60_014519 [Juncus effusus]
MENYSPEKDQQVDPSMENYSPEKDQQVDPSMENYSPEKDQQMEDPPSTEKKTQAPNISELKPVTHEAYGGGMYATDDRKEAETTKGHTHTRASKTQSADGPEEKPIEPKHKPPLSTGDKDLDITGMSYIQ